MANALVVPRHLASSEGASRSRESSTPGSDGGLSAFMRVRGRLFGIAYRMLGSAAEAEDILQDVWVRWQTTDRSRVDDPGAFLATATRRLAINVMQSARARREKPVPPGLPDPVDTRADPGLGAERREATDVAVLLLLENLSPYERAAYVLREAFDYPYRMIADVLEVQEANARQLVTRAREHLSTTRPRPVSTAEHRRLFDEFIAAARTGDLTSLESLFVTALRPSRGRPVAPQVRSARCSTTSIGRLPATRAAADAPHWPAGPNRCSSPERTERSVG